MIALFDEFPAGAHPTKDQYEHFSIGRADERTARRAQAARASTNDDGQTVADTADMDEEEYNDADVELPHQERIGHDVATVHTSTVAFHQKILRELEDGQDEPGGRPPYHEWQSMWVEPPDPMVVVPFSEAAWHVQPICFFDPTVYFGRIGMESARPCARGGWRHARFVRVQNDGKFRRPRLLKGRGADYGLSTVDMQCSECRRERCVLLKRHKAAKSQLGAQSNAVVALEGELQKCSYGFSALDPAYISFLAQRCPFMLTAVPFSTSHKAAVMHDVILECGRAMRTSQSSCDIEALYDEMRGLRCTMKHLGFASVQRCVLKHAERRGRLGEMGAGDSQPPSINEQWVELNEAAVSKISDNYVTNIQLAHFAKAETYFNQWHEQHVPNTELVHVDHHGKRDAAIRLNGSKDLMWTYTEMNGLGHKTLSVKCNTTSMNDSSLVAAYDRRVRASARWNLIKVCRFLHLSRACQFRALGDDIFSLSFRSFPGPARDE